MCRYADGEAMIRVRKTTRERLRALVEYHRRAADHMPGPAWWARDDGPGAGEVIDRLIDFFEAWVARRRRAAQNRKRHKNNAGPAGTRA